MRARALPAANQRREKTIAVNASLDSKMQNDRRIAAADRTHIVVLYSIRCGVRLDRSWQIWDAIRYCQLIL